MLSWRTGIAEFAWPGPVSQTGHDPPHDFGIPGLFFVAFYDVKIKIIEAQKWHVLIGGVVHDPNEVPLYAPHLALMTMLPVLAVATLVL